MSPNQYRALDRLLAAGGAGLPITRQNPAPDHTIYRAQAEALERRGLARIEPTAGDPFVVITRAGVELLAANPTGTPTRPGAPR